MTRVIFGGEQSTDFLAHNGRTTSGKKVMAKNKMNMRTGIHHGVFGPSEANPAITIENQSAGMAPKIELNFSVNRNFVASSFMNSHHIDSKIIPEIFSKNFAISVYTNPICPQILFPIS
jgi:hypothetical protein